MATSWQQDDAKPSSQEKQPQQAQPPPAAAPAAKKKRVLTNDDLEGSGGGSGFGSANFSEVNDCDRYCFENLKNAVSIDPVANPHWRLAILQAIDLVRKDSEWQGILRELYDLSLKRCDLAAEKRGELNMNSDPRNVTPQEVGVEERYEIKFKELQKQQSAVLARQSALQSAANDNPVAFRFRVYQEAKVQNGVCAQQPTPWYPPSDRSDP